MIPRERETLADFTYNLKMKSWWHEADLCLEMAEGTLTKQMTNQDLELDDVESKMSDE